jgi:multiple sugar transport system permease protein
MQEFAYALAFISSSDRKPATLGVAIDPVRGTDGRHPDRQSVAIAHNLILDGFISGITRGAVR